MEEKLEELNSKCQPHPQGEEKKKLEERSKLVKVKINGFLNYTMGQLYTTKFTTY